MQWSVCVIQAITRMIDRNRYRAESFAWFCLLVYKRFNFKAFAELLRWCLNAVHLLADTASIHSVCLCMCLLIIKGIHWFLFHFRFLFRALSTWQTVNKHYSLYCMWRWAHKETHQRFIWVVILLLFFSRRSPSQGNAESAAENEVIVTFAWERYSTAQSAEWPKIHESFRFRRNEQYQFAVHYSFIAGGNFYKTSGGEAPHRIAGERRKSKWKSDIREK